MAPAAHLGDRVGGLVEHDVDAAGHQILHRRGAAAIGHESRSAAGDLLEIHAGDLGAAGGAGPVPACALSDWL